MYEGYLKAQWSVEGSQQMTVPLPDMTQAVIFQISTEKNQKADVKCMDVLISLTFTACGATFTFVL